MKFSKTLVLSAAAMALAVGSAYAADKPVKERSAVGNVGAATASDESGFAKLDKNKDGYISKAEAMGDARLSKDFAKFDLNNDGKLNRAEYLAASAKEDVISTKDKVSDKINKDKEPAASAGSTTNPK